MRGSADVFLTEFYVKQVLGPPANQDRSVEALAELGQDLYRVSRYRVRSVDLGKSQGI